MAVELPKDDALKIKKHILSQEEAQLLINEARINDDAMIFAFAVLSGLRLGEILALTHTDIDIENELINVNKTVGFLTIDGVFKPIVSSPKTENSTRKVPIMGILKPLLEKHIINEKSKHLRTGTPFSQNSILFSSTACTYLEGGNVRKRFKKLLDKLNIPQTSFHALRHSFCSGLSEKGVPLKTASMLMGHSSISITAELYTHASDLELKRGIERAEKGYY